MTSEPAWPFFSSDAFFAAVAEIYFLGRPWAAEFVTAGGRTFRVLAVDGVVVDRLQGTAFYYEPVEASSGPAHNRGG